MGVWCFCFGMGRRLKCEKSSSPVGEIRQGCFFVMIQVHNCKILALPEAFQHLGNYPTRLLFHFLFLSKTHLILLSPIDTPQKTPPIVCFLKKRRAIVCTLGYESKKSCTRFFECMILTLYHQRYDCGGGEACSSITTYLQPFKMGNVRNCVDFCRFIFNWLEFVTVYIQFLWYTILRNES